MKAAARSLTSASKPLDDTGAIASNPRRKKERIIAMRKFVCGLLVFCLLSVGALAAPAEEDGAWTPDLVEEAARETVFNPPRRMLMLQGKIVTGKTVTVPAPFGGILADYSLRKGDIVAAGETLFTIETTKVYAPVSGKAGALGAQVGDAASYLQDQYGAVLFIEPDNQFIVQTDTKEAYGTDENLFIHVGETVYIGSRSSAERIGTGFVTAVNGKSYTVEVLDGNLVMDDNVALFRDRTFDVRSRIGNGKVSKKANIAITADGSIFAMHVSQGQAVKRGDLLFETVNGSIAYNMFPTRQVVSDYAAVIASIDATPGSNVSQRQVLATLYLLGDFQIAVDVTEPDLQNIHVGDTVRVELAGVFEPGEPVYGTIASISGLSSGAEEPEYTVYIDFAAIPAARAGMIVNVYCNEP